MQLNEPLSHETSQPPAPISRHVTTATAAIRPVLGHSIINPITRALNAFIAQNNIKLADHLLNRFAPNIEVNHIAINAAFFLRPEKEQKKWKKVLNKYNLWYPYLHDKECEIVKKKLVLISKTVIMPKKFLGQLFLKEAPIAPLPLPTALMSLLVHIKYSRPSYVPLIDSTQQQKRSYWLFGLFNIELYYLFITFLRCLKR